MVIYTVEEFVYVNTCVRYVFTTQEKADQVCEELNLLERAKYKSSLTFYVVKEYEADSYENIYH